MNKIVEINNRLKYTEFINIPDEQWKTLDVPFYKNTITEQLANDYDFLNTFKDKIDWNFLFNYHMVKQSIIEKFISYYSNEAWDSLLRYQKYDISFINKYYRYIKKPMPLRLYYHKNKDEIYEQLSSQAMNYLLIEQGYKFVLDF